MPNILVVDDSKVDRRLVGGLLSNAGHNDWVIDYAEDGAEAIKAVAEKEYDMIITDLVMPEVDGFGLVKSVKKTHPKTPVILVTSKGNEDIALKALRLGAASYTPKNRLAQTLVPTIEDILKVTAEQEPGTRVASYLSEVHYHFDLNNDLSIAFPLVRFLQKEAASIANINQEQRLRFGVVLKEALTNAMIRGNLEMELADLQALEEPEFQQAVSDRASQSPYNSRKVNLEVRLSPDSAEVRVRDEGPGFPVATFAEPVERLIEKNAGRGMIVLRTFADKVSYNEAGNELTIQKNWVSDQ